MKEIVSAEEQYRKFPELKKEDVQELAAWISQHPEYPTPSEEEVIRFLLCCYSEMENAKKCVYHYYTIKLEHTEFFLGRDVLIDELKKQLEVVEYGVIPKKDPNGYTVAVHRLQVFDPSEYIFVHSCRLFGMLVEALNREEGCMKGFVIIFDMRGVSLMHLFRLKLSTLKLFLHYVQEGCPLRLKAVHVVNTLPVTAKIMFVIRPFIKKEILDLLHFHSDNYDDIKQFVPAECLPSDYDGTQPSIALLHEDFKKWMLEMRDLFIEDDAEIKNFIDKRKAETEASKKKSSSWSFF